MCSGKKLASLIFTGFLLLLLFGNGNACRMYATIGYDLPDGMLYDHLRGDQINFPNSLYYLSSWNRDGWGIGYYPDFGNFPTIARGKPAAQSDLQFTATVEEIDSSEPQITMAHIRAATSGCRGVDDPHPFYRDKIGKRWLFEVNGGPSSSITIGLIDQAYLAENPPNGSGIPECASSVVDSEYYFLLILEKIEENGWNVVNGVAEAIRELQNAGDVASKNFIMSDGETLWAFRRGDSAHTLNYLYDSNAGYAAVASQSPSAGQGNWIPMPDFQLVVFRPGGPPVVIDDVKTYCPGDISGDGQVDADDLELLADHFGQGGNGDLDFDEDVDGTDLAAMAAVYGKACP
jgi:predicted glutamine amidotransferase